MKTTPDGLTHLIHMLVDVVNLQRKALATPNACCDVDVEYGFAEEASRVTVKLTAEVDVAAPAPASPPTLSADNNRDPDGPHGVTPRQAVIEVLDELGLTHFGGALSADNNPLTMDEMVAAQREAIARARMSESPDEPAAR